MSVIFECPSCGEISGYTVTETMNLIEDCYTGNARPYQNIYIQCASCGAIMLSPFDDEFNQDERDKAKHSLMYEKLS